MFNTNLKHVSFRNTLTFTLIVLVLQITIVLGMENPGTLVSCHCTEDQLPCNKVIGAAILLIVIRLQAKFLFS